MKDELHVSLKCGSFLRVGNAFYVVLPSSWVKTHKLKKDDTVILVLGNGFVDIYPKDSVKEFSSYITEERKIVAIGDSFVVSIPTNWIRDLGWEEDSEILCYGDSICRVEKATLLRKKELANLLFDNRQYVRRGEHV